MKSREHPSSSSVKFVDHIEERAAAWLARRYGGFSAEDTNAFAAWLAADPRHGLAVANLERAWQVVSAPGAAGQGGIARQRQQVREKWRARRLATGMAAAALVALVVFVSLPARWSPTELTTRIVVRPDLQRLSDGSVAQLNAGAEIAIAFTGEQRAVRLVRGEALFQVASDPRRPFVVSANGVQVTAVGTAFTVRSDPHHVAVLVTEGTVAVVRTGQGAADSATVATPARPEPEPIRVSAGHRTEISLVPESVPAVSPATPAEIAAALAWRERRVEFTGTSLADAFALFNRQNVTQLTAADARTAEFEISGIFWIDDPESFVRLLESTFDMNVERVGQKMVMQKR
jgi:transmembrane sensor